MDAIIFIISLVILILIISKHKDPYKPNFRQNLLTVFIALVLVLLVIFMFASGLHFALRFGIEIKSFLMSL